MNRSIFVMLLKKDWQIMRLFLIGYAITGLLTALLTTQTSGAGIYAGIVILISIAVAASVHIIIKTIILEQKEKNLPFILSLPLTPKGYALAKIAINMILYGGIWLSLVLACIGITVLNDSIPNGIIIYGLLSAGCILINFCFIMLVAMISTSESWTIASIVITNISLNLFMNFTLRVPGVGDQMKSDTVIWQSDATAIISSEILLTAALLCITVFLQARKKDFI